MMMPIDDYYGDDDNDNYDDEEAPTTTTTTTTTIREEEANNMDNTDIIIIDDEQPQEHHQQQQEQEDGELLLHDATSPSDYLAEMSADIEEELLLVNTTTTTTTDQPPRDYTVVDEEEGIVDFNQQQEQGDESSPLAFDGYSLTQGDEENNEANNACVSNAVAAVAAAAANSVTGTDDAETNNNNNNIDMGNNTTVAAEGGDDNDHHHEEEERDPELGGLLPSSSLADLDSDNDDNDNEEEEEEDFNYPQQQQDGDDEETSSYLRWRRRTLHWLRFFLHIFFFPLLVITSVAIPVLIVMFCFALMFVALVVLLCVYYCCSPRRGDQAAVPFHVLIRQILEAVEDETHGLGGGGGHDPNNDAPKYTRREIQNCLLRRELVHFQCSDPTTLTAVPDPEPTDAETREERMHQDMFPVIIPNSSSSNKGPIQLTSASEEEAAEEDEEIHKSTATTSTGDGDGGGGGGGGEGFAASFRWRLFRRRRKKKKDVDDDDDEVLDHNESYELRLSKQKITFATDPAANNSKLFLLKRTFVFSPPLGPPTKADHRSVSSSSSSSNENSPSDDEETRNYNLAVAALEDSSSSSSSSGSRFLHLLASSSSSSSSESSESSSRASAPEAATAESSDVSFITEGSNIDTPIIDPLEPGNFTSDQQNERITSSRNNPPSGIGHDGPTVPVASEYNDADVHDDPLLSPSSDQTESDVPSSTCAKMGSHDQSDEQSSTQPISTDVLSPSTTTSISDDNGVLNADLDAVLNIEVPMIDQEVPPFTAEEEEEEGVGPSRPPIAGAEKESNDHGLLTNAMSDAEEASSLASINQNDVEKSNSHMEDTQPRREKTGLSSPRGMTAHETEGEIDSFEDSGKSDEESSSQAALLESSPSPKVQTLALNNNTVASDASMAASPPGGNEALGSVASLMIHPAFLPLEEAKTEISSGEGSEEAKTEVTAYDRELHSPTEPSEETKTEISVYEGEIHALSSDLKSPMEPASPIEPVESPVDTSDAPAANGASPEETSPDTSQPKAIEQPEHRGISSYCTICLMEYEVGDVVVWSRRPHGCHHAFHQDCLLDWLQRKPTCPHCRQEFFAIEDAPKHPDPSQDDGEGSSMEGNHMAVPESTHTPSNETRPSRRFW